MKLLIIGKDGQLSTELARRSGAHAVTQLGLDVVDLTQPESGAQAIAAHPADVIINATAYTAVDAAEENQALARAINATGVAAMAKAAAAADTPFLHVSTDYVFDGSGNHRWTEGMETGPLGVYGQTKLEGENAIIRTGGDFAILRTAWVFSAHGGNFVKTMLRLGAERDALSIVDDQIGGPTPAADIAAALLVMADAFAAGRGTSGLYHFAGAPDTSWAGFAQAIFDRAGMRVDITRIASEDYPTPAARPKNSRLECAKIAADYGIAAPDWQAGLDAVLKELGAYA